MLLQLKMSWIRRVIKADENTKWFILLQATIPNVTHFEALGANFVKHFLRDLKNNFWKDVFKAWITFSQSESIQTVESWNDFLIQPIWCNEIIKVGGRCIFYKTWFEKGISHVLDLTDNNGNFLSFNEFTNKFGINSNFFNVPRSNTNT